MLKKVINHYQMNHSQTFYVGDETRDIEAEKKANIYSIAVIWGLIQRKC